MQLGKYESSSFWMSILTDLKACVDEDRSVFPKSKTQICVVHQIRNACKHVAWKNCKQFTADMKLS
jgi:transposase-like protein